jgi:hypothetical protein
VIRRKQSQLRCSTGEKVANRSFHDPDSYHAQPWKITLQHHLSRRPALSLSTALSRPNLFPCCYFADGPCHDLSKLQGHQKTRHHFSLDWPPRARRPHSVECRFRLPTPRPVTSMTGLRNHFLNRWRANLKAREPGSFFAKLPRGLAILSTTCRSFRRTLIKVRSGVSMQPNCGCVTSELMISQQFP